MIRQYLRAAYHKIGVAASSGGAAVVTFFTKVTLNSTSDLISTPDSALNSSVTDGGWFNIVWKAQADNLASGSRMCAVGKYNFTVGNNRCYAGGHHENARKLFMANSDTGSAVSTAVSYREIQDPGQNPSWFMVQGQVSGAGQGYQSCAIGLPGPYDWGSSMALSGTLRSAVYDGNGSVCVGSINDGSTQNYLGEIWYAAQRGGFVTISGDTLVNKAVFDARDYSSATSYGNTGAETDWTTVSADQGGEVASTAIPYADALSVLIRRSEPRRYFRIQGRYEGTNGGNSAKNQNVQGADGAHVNISKVASIISGNPDFGGAADYAGGSQYTVATSASITDYPLTMSCFMKIDGGATIDHYLMTTADASNATQRMWIGYGSDGIAKFGKGNSTTAYTAVGTTDITDNAVHHVAAVFTDATTAKLYVNGVEEASITDSVTGHTWDQWYIARNYAIGNQYLGVMAEIVYMATAATPETLLSWTNAQGVQEYAPPPYEYVEMINSGNYEGANATSYSLCRVTGEFEFQYFGSLDDWTPAVQAGLACMWQSTGDQRGWLISIQSTGEPELHITGNGLNSDVDIMTSTAATGNTNGVANWLKVTWTPSGVATFYKGGTDIDSPSWTQLGSTVATTKSAIHASTADFTLGGYDEGNQWKYDGKVGKVILKSGIDGTVVANFDATIDYDYGLGSFQYRNSASPANPWNMSYNPFNNAAQPGFF